MAKFHVGDKVKFDSDGPSRWAGTMGKVVRVIPTSSGPRLRVRVLWGPLPDTIYEMESLYTDWRFY